MGIKQFNEGDSMRFYTNSHPFYCGIDLHARIFLYSFALFWARLWAQFQKVSFTLHESFKPHDEFSNTFCSPMPYSMMLIKWSHWRIFIRVLLSLLTALMQALLAPLLSTLIRLGLLLGLIAFSRKRMAALVSRLGLDCDRTKILKVL